MNNVWGVETALISVLSGVLMSGVAWSATEIEKAAEPSAVNAARAQAKAPAGTERHFANIRQVTTGRQNAEAYFSFEGDKLVFQSTNDWTGATGDALPQAKDPAANGLGCYQMYVLDLDTGQVRIVSKGIGATTCGYFFPGGRRVLYSSTHGSGAACPPKPNREDGYRWALDDYDVYSNRLDGQQIHRLTATPGYDAEATVSPDGKSIVWTSVRDGDLDLYAMNIDGTHVRRLTTELGYDGGAFFSPDSRRIVYRAQHPQTVEEVDEYQALLKQKLVKPNRLEIFTMQADGSNKRQVTHNGASNFAPYFHPDGRRIVYSSNATPGERTFHLYLIDDDGANVEQLTTEGHFNSFPMFSPDGKRVVWVSDRNATAPGEFNVFVADWVP